MLLADDSRLEDTRRGGQRVHSGVNTLRCDGTVELCGRIQVGEHGRRSRVGVVVGGDVDSLQRGNRTALGRRNALLELTHLISQCWLVTHSRRHAAQQRGNLGTCLAETEDIVDEEQHVLVLNVTEVLRHRQPGESHTHTNSRRLVHLTEHEGRILEHAHLFHFEEEVRALTGTLTDAGEY